VPKSTDHFVAEVLHEVPEVQAVVREHLEDNDGEPLLHLLIADLRRYALQAFDAKESDVLGRLLGAVDRAMRDGDDSVENAIGVSFVEDTGWWDDATKPFIAVWPEGLRAEAARQREWRLSR
jgi:hypothetical protein